MTLHRDSSPRSSEAEGRQRTSDGADEGKKLVLITLVAQECHYARARISLLSHDNQLSFIRLTGRPSTHTRLPWDIVALVVQLDTVWPSLGLCPPGLGRPADDGLLKTLNVLYQRHV